MRWRIAVPDNRHIARSIEAVRPIRSLQKRQDNVAIHALGVAVAIVGRLANRPRHRQSGDRHRLAPSGLSLVLDVEGSPRWPTSGRARGPRMNRTMSEANSLWGAPRIHGELLKLGSTLLTRCCRATGVFYPADHNEGI
jgi:hypothetical protein